MLVLTRRVGERLLIGEDIVLTVVEVRSDGVRLGIEAPKSVKINRPEVLEAIARANQPAAETDSDIQQLAAKVAGLAHSAQGA